MDLGLEGKSIFVAGSSRGIGFEIARCFLEEGANVFISGRNQERLSQALSTLKGEAPDKDVRGFIGDLSVGGQAKKAIGDIVEAFGKIDVLIANIGSGKGKRGWDLDNEDWQNALMVNLQTNALVAKTAIPFLMESKGSIVFISSIVASEAVDAPLQYSAAKAAQESYAKNLSRELAKYPIRVNTVSPGNVLFEGGGWKAMLDQNPEEVDDYIAREVPLKRFGTPREIAAGVIFLSSEAARFITGATLVIDGGQSRST